MRCMVPGFAAQSFCRRLIFQVIFCYVGCRAHTCWLPSSHINHVLYTERKLQRFDKQMREGGDYATVHVAESKARVGRNVGQVLDSHQKFADYMEAAAGKAPGENSYDKELCLPWITPRRRTKVVRNTKGRKVQNESVWPVSGRSPDCAKHDHMQTRNDARFYDSKCSARQSKCSGECTHRDDTRLGYKQGAHKTNQDNKLLPLDLHSDTHVPTEALLDLGLSTAKHLLVDHYASLVSILDGFFFFHGHLAVTFTLDFAII